MRRGRGLALTEAGRIALDHAEAIFRSAEDLAATLAHRDPSRRVLRIGALATLSRNFQMAFLRPALGRPGVEVILRSGGQADLLAALAAQALDVVLTDVAPTRDAATPWLVQRLAEQQVGLIGTPAAVGAARPLARLLAEVPLILPTPESALRAAFDAVAAGLGVTPVVLAEADDMAMMRLLAREGAGLAVIPPIVVGDELASGALIEAQPLPGVRETFYAVTLSRRFPNPLALELCAAAGAEVSRRDA